MAHTLENEAAELDKLEAKIDSRESMGSDFVSAHRAHMARSGLELEMLLFSDSSDYSKISNHQKNKLQELRSKIDMLLGNGSLPTLEEISTLTNIARDHNDAFQPENQSLSKSEVQEDSTSDDNCSIEMQEAVGELHKALVAGWPKTCDPPHQAMLRLTVNTGEEKASKGGKGIEFNVIATAHSQHWVENKFVVGFTRPRTIKFEDMPKCTASRNTVDVCQLIESCASKMRYVSISVHSNALQSSSNVVPKRGAGKPKSRFKSRISLRSLMALGRGNQIGKFIWSRSLLEAKHKVILPVILAYSFWHLSKDAWGKEARSGNEGPWLQRRWAEQGVYFVLTDHKTIDIGRPYLPAIIDTPDFDPDLDMSEAQHPSPSIFAFALVLIELQCHELFIEIRNNMIEEEGCVTLNTEYFAVIELLEDPRFCNSVSINYQDAINACVRGDFIIEFGELEEWEVRQMFFRDVIVPLKSELKNNWKLPPERLQEQFEVSIPDHLIQSEMPKNTVVSTSTNVASLTNSSSSLKPDLINATPLSYTLPNGHDESEDETSEDERVNDDDDIPSPLRPRRTLTIEAGHDGLLCHGPEKIAGIKHSAVFDILNQSWKKWFRFKDKDEIVKVAILDTGIDKTHDDFRNARAISFTKGIPVAAPDEPCQIDRIIACENFCSDDKFDIHDTNGHGTQVAGIILRLAPRARLYIARICEGRSESSNESGTAQNAKAIINPTPETVKNAVDWAITKGVHVINMSFGFNKKNKVVAAALERAQSNKILIFAAMANDGIYKKAAWPARAPEYSIGVHSCEEEGKNDSKFTPKPVDYISNFMTIGENIIVHQLTVKGGGFYSVNGTSFATPVAVAISALILAFAGQDRCKSDRKKVEQNLDGKLLETLRSGSIMIKILRKISVPTGGYFWINPELFWSDFPKPGEVDDHDGIKKRAWDLIAEVLED